MLTSGGLYGHTLHAISFNYPVNPKKEDKVTYLNFFKSIEVFYHAVIVVKTLKNIKSVPLTLSTVKIEKLFLNGFITSSKK